ncbi:MAG: ABC transporter ATP-binding protein [Methylobacteriaceae bacterium]|nr:ABC transporter ATP-binding protein [Methylobacteriaceae bacterium]
MSSVSLQSVIKRYGATTAVDNVSLTIAEGDLVALLGPSGCGKTTTLRMIGGFVDVTEGRIVIGGRDVTRLPASSRNIGFGFQNYALFPHMTVAQNVAFGLEMRRTPKADIGRKVAAALDRVRLSAHAEKHPKQLSGGQQQRVALARALIIEPDVLLLDEPLSNLDAQLRQDMKSEIRQLQKTFGITTIFVTHDQDEALSVADRIVVMRQGRVEQDGAPEAIFSAPRSRFVAEFMGVTNLFDCVVIDRTHVRLSTGDTVPMRSDLHAGTRALLSLRPERIELHERKASACDYCLRGFVESVTYHGGSMEYSQRTRSGLTLTVRRPTPALGGPPVLSQGTEVSIEWSAGAALPIKID